MFWLCLVFSLVLPLGMLVYGLSWLRRPPARNARLCYRTEASSHSEETWRFAHRYIGKLWLRCAILLLPITVGVMLYFRESYMSYLPWVMAAQGGLFAFSLFPTEGSLQLHFPKEEELPSAEMENASTVSESFERF